MLWRAAIWCLASLTLLPLARAESYGGRLSQTWRWRPVELPPGADRPVALDSDNNGHLIVLFERRLARFDGHRWQTLLPRDAVERLDVHEVIAIDRGVALIAPTSVYLCSSAGKITRVARGARKGTRALFACRGPDGRLLVVIGTTIYRLGLKGLTEHIELPSNGSGISIMASPSGLYARTTRKIWRHDGREWREIAFSEEHLPADSLISRMMLVGGDVRLVIRRRGVAWRVVRWDGKAARFEAQLAGAALAGQLVLPGDRLLLAADSGAPLRLLEDNWWRELTPIALEHQRIVEMCLLRPARLAAILASGKLVTCDLRKPRWGAFRAEGTEQMNVNAIAPSSRGGYWLACSNRGLLRWVAGQGVVERHATALGTPLKILTTVIEDERGHVWTASGSEFTGVFRFDGARWHRHQEADGIGGYCVHSITRGGPGELWFMLLAPRAGQLTPNGGVVRQRAGKWQRYSTADGLPHDRCYQLARMRDGTIYVGTLHGLAVLEGQRWRPMGERKPARALHVNGDTLWVGYGRDARGIEALRDGAPRSLPVRMANAAQSAEAFTSTPDGALWFTARDGIHRYDPALGLMTRPSDEPGLHFGSLWPIVAASDGSLLVGTMGQGVIQLKPDGQPPRIVELGVTSKDDGRTVVARWTGRDAWYTTPTRLLQYRWRLDEQEWSVPGTATQTTIGQLEAGEHRLQVQVFDTSGNASSIDSFAFSVSRPLLGQPVVWGTFLFCLVAICGLGLALMRTRRLRQRAEAAQRATLEASERKFRALVESAHLLLSSMDKEGRLEYVSPGLSELAGVGDSALGELPAGVFDNIHEADRSQFERLHALDAKLTHAEFRVRDQAGDYRWVFARRSPRGEGEQGADLVGVDITERKAAEDAMRHAEKLKSLGVLAGGIAHDFNNLLMGVLGNAELLRDTLPPGDATEHLDEIMRASQRCAELCRQMLAYAGQGQFQIELIDLSALVEEMGQFIRATISRRIELKVELSPDLPGVRGDAAQLRQVVLNFLTNAAEAIGDDVGEIRLSVSMREVGLDTIGGLVVSDELSPGSCVCLDVIDTGRGMDPDQVARIFDPFFSTKSEGRGLGLAAVQGIVRAHDGGLGLVTRPGHGSTFTLLLPSTGKRPPRPRPVAPSVPQGTQQILLMDDDPTVRRVVGRMLDIDGWSVLTAEDGPSGVALLKQHGDTIDAVIMDMTMPGGSAEETHAAIRALRPDVPLLIISGFVESSIPYEWQQAGPTAFTQKPFRKESLLDGLLRAGLGGAKS